MFYEHVLDWRSVDGPPGTAMRAGANGLLAALAAVLARAEAGAGNVREADQVRARAAQHWSPPRP